MVVQVLVAMSGGVDSSVAAALLAEQGHEVVGATLKLWGGPSSSGCCSAADVQDARRVAASLGIDHYVFSDTEVFDEMVVRPYVESHVAGATPNPCIACNLHLKFGLLLERATRLGFDALATGHHARIEARPSGARLMRGVDAAKDQSYVLAPLAQSVLERILLPVGELTKREVRDKAARLDLCTAAKPDSQDVCFVAPGGGRVRFLADRMALHEGELVDAESGEVVGSVDALELVTPGQRRGLGAGPGGTRRYALQVDVSARKVLVGDVSRARASRVALSDLRWCAAPPEGPARVLAQASAHGPALPGALVLGTPGWRAPGSNVTCDAVLTYDDRQRLVAPGQTVAFYDPASPDLVIGAATCVDFPAVLETAGCNDAAAC